MNAKKIICIITILLLTFSLGVKASSLIYSKDVTYDNTGSGLSSNTVQGALDELYEKAKNGGASVSCDEDGNCTVTCSQGDAIISNTGYSCPIIVKCKNDELYHKISNGYKCILPAGKQILKNIDVVTSGDGLYKDNYENGRYIYRGANVNNYIEFNNTTWRIISIESDGALKLIEPEHDLSNMFDTINNRNWITNTYCSSSGAHGCNAWVATANMVNSPTEFIQYYPNGNINDSANYSGTVLSDSNMATYLNETYYNGLSENSKNKLIKGIFNISTPGNTSDTETLKTDAKQEKQYRWKGYVALYTVTELLRASTNAACTNLKTASLKTVCKVNNWLWPKNREWTLSPFVDSFSYNVWLANSDGSLTYVDSESDYYRYRAVVYLTPNSIIKGSGTLNDKYVIS